MRWNVLGVFGATHGCSIIGVGKIVDTVRRCSHNTQGNISLRSNGQKEGCKAHEARYVF